MAIIDDDKLQNILPKYSELKLSGKNLAQQYVSAFNTGMNIYQCINQLQGYIEWVIKAVNDVVVQWNEVVNEQVKYAINESITASKQVTTEQFNIEWKKVQPVLKTLENNVLLKKIGTKDGDDYLILTESKDKNTKRLDYYFNYTTTYRPTDSFYYNNIYVSNLDLEGYTVRKSFLTEHICKLKNKSTDELIDYVYLMLADNVKLTNIKDDPTYPRIGMEMKLLPYFAKIKTDTPVEGKLYIDTCISVIFNKTST